MKKAFAFLSIVVFLAACASTAPVATTRASLSEQWDSGRIVADSHEGTFVVFGVSSRLPRLEDEIDAAKNYAARLVSMFHGVNGTTRFINRTSGSVLDFIAESTIDITPIDANYTRFVEHLVFDPDRDVLRFDGKGLFGRGGTLVRFRYAARVPHVNIADTTDADGRPYWVSDRNLPNIDGYRVAVGFSQNQEWLRDTVMRATEAVAARLIEATHTATDTTTVEVSGVGTVTYITRVSSGVLNNFRILEFWVDPNNMSVYTLGIARLIN